MDKTIILRPIFSEKAYALSLARNTYVFAVPKDANKHTVARAVSAQYDVTVVEVNIANIPGKAKRTVRKSGRAVMGRQSDVQKAYVTLKDGDSLPIFAALEDDKAADKSSKSDKKDEKGKDK
jgi:large subunit ribosomal protein L23